jgi:hypothetical protein
MKRVWLSEKRIFFCTERNGYSAGNYQLLDKEYTGGIKYFAGNYRILNDKSTGGMEFRQELQDPG